MPVIDDVYLPFHREDIKKHFPPSSWEKYLRELQTSADRYRTFNRGEDLCTIKEMKTPCQIEKDERFWTISALKKIHDSPDRIRIWKQLLDKALPQNPGWREICDDTNTTLEFEKAFSSPKGYTKWLRDNSNKDKCILIPYVRKAADMKGDSACLEGPTMVDAVFTKAEGERIFIESKVLSDLSTSVTFDCFRNQLIRSIDILIEEMTKGAKNSYFLLLTPERFEKRRGSRIYGWLFNKYTQEWEAMQKDLEHRSQMSQQEWEDIANRLGWITFEQINRACPGACPWLNERHLKK